MFFRKILFFLLFLPVGVCVAQTEDSTDLNPPVDSFIEVDQEPRPLNLDSVTRKVRFPNELKKKKIQGKVFIKILIDKDGKVIQHVVKKSPHPLFVEEVERVIYHLRFSPAIDKGKIVMYWVSIPFNFTLK